MSKKVISLTVAQWEEVIGYLPLSDLKKEISRQFSEILYRDARLREKTLDIERNISKAVIKLAEERSKRLKDGRTKAEIATINLLNSLGINYEFQKIIYTKVSFFIVDFYFPELNTVLEVDGAYHLDSSQKKKDSRRTSSLLKQGITQVKRLSNKQAFGISPSQLAKILNG